MNTKKLFEKFHEIASHPGKQKEMYLSSGRKVVITAPIYVPNEIIHSMGLIPMGAWGADIELAKAKKYFPSFICSIVQSIIELGMNGAYQGASALLVPTLCDSLKALGENWKYAVPSIPYIPVMYPQNRAAAYGIAFTTACYERVIHDLEKTTNSKFDKNKLQKSIEIYNEHNALMRKVAKTFAAHAGISAQERSDVFKSAFFMQCEDHTALVHELLDSLGKDSDSDVHKTGIVTSGIIADSPDLLKLIDEYGLHIVADDMAAESRQYRTDTPVSGDPLNALAQKFAQMDNCSVLYDVNKKRVAMIVRMVKEAGAKGVLVILTKFCDPEEFDYPLIKKACEAASVPVAIIEVDRQMSNYEQARTVIESFRDVIN